MNITERENLNTDKNQHHDEIYLFWAFSSSIQCGPRGNLVASVLAG